MSELVIVDSRVANLASIAGAFRRLNATITVTADPGVVRGAARLVLPGVGAFGAGMAALRARGLDTVIRDVAARGTPLLGVCLGMQMLCDASDETPGVAGLGIIAGTCRRLPANVRIPHLGWNRVTPEPEARLLSPGVAAFANSYALREGPAGWTTAWTTHGVPFIAALERGPTIACQFHPELSGAYGAALLERWLTGKIVRPPRAAPATDASPGLLRRIIPCLDVKDGRVVKGIRFQDLRDAGDPAEQAARYEAQGADEIVILDVAASAEGRDTQVETVRRVRAAIRIPLTVGGGVRSVVDARRAAEGWEVLVIGGREIARPDAVAWARDGESLGAGEILLTSWDRDGTRAGHDLDLLRAVSDAVRVPVIASGGVGTRAHVAAAFAGGADAVLAASVFHDGDDTVDGIKADLAVRGIRVRQ